MCRRNWIQWPVWLLDDLSFSVFKMSVFKIGFQISYIQHMELQEKLLLILLIFQVHVLSLKMYVPIVLMEVRLL